MFEQIPALKKSPDVQSLGIHERRNHIPLLSPMVIKPSRWLWKAQLIAHCLLGISFILVLVPLIAQNSLWMALLCVLIGCLGVSLRVQQQALSQPPKVLSYSTQGWLLSEPDGERSVHLVGETVVWSWLVILRLKDNARTSTITLVLLPDSFSSENSRVLRVWLRTQVGRNPA